MAETVTELRPALVPGLFMLAGDGVPLLDWPTAQPEPAYNHIFLVNILGINPKSFDVEVRKITPRVGLEQAHLDVGHLSDLLTNGVQDQIAELGDLNLRLRTDPGALVIFHLSDPTAIFHDPAYPDDAKRVVLRSEIEKGSTLFQAAWLGGIPGDKKTVSTILGGFDVYGYKRFSYGLKVQVTSAKGTVSYLEIDPKIENDGEGGGGRGGSGVVTPAA